MREWLEYGAVWLIVKGLGLLPRPVARPIASALARFIYVLLPRLQKPTCASLSRIGRTRSDNP